MNNSPFVQKPVRLVSVTEQGKYTLHQDGINFLSHIQKPLGVVSVAGLYRTGKSYLLNRMLLNKSSGFGVGSTINACTKGLWCWGTPIKGTTPDGQKINVIIIDSQGIGALDQDQNHDTKIFTLAVLSASTFIYNSVGSIDQNALQNLSLVVNLSKNIQINTHSQEQDVDPQQLAEYFPSFCWVVRDFSLQLINSNGDTITPNQYLERALSLQKGFSDDIEDKNRIRRLLTTFFKNRDCITLVRPLVNQSKLQQLQKLQLEELRPQFVEQVLQLRKKILQKLSPKKFKNQLLDGKMYLNILMSYVNAINEGAVPNMQNAWSYMCQQKCYNTFEECCDILQKQTKEITIPNEINNINKQIQEIEQKIMKKYLQDTKGMQKQGKNLYMELKQKVKQQMNGIRKNNQINSMTLLKNYAHRNFSPIEKMVINNEFSKYTDYIKQLNQYYNTLLQSGPNLVNKQYVYTDFIRRVSIQGAQLFIKNINKNYQNKKILWEEEKSHINKKIQDLRAQHNRELNLKKQQIKQMDEENTQLMGNLQQCKLQLQRIKIKQSQKQKEYNKQLKQRKQQYESESRQLLKQINQIKVLLKEIEKQKYQIEKQLQKNTAIFQLKQEQYLQQIEQYKRKQCQHLTQRIRNKQQIQSKYSNIIKQLQNRMNQYKKKYQIQTIKNQQIKEKVILLQQNIQTIQHQLKQNNNQSNQQLQLIKAQSTNKTNLLQSQIISLQNQLQQLKTLNKQLTTQLANKQTQSDQINAQLQQRLNQQLQQYKKQKALYEQKISFIQLQLKQVQQTNNNNVQYYQNRIQQLQTINKQISTKFNEDKLRSLQSQLSVKYKAIEKQLTEEKYVIQNQLCLLTKQKQNLIFSLQIQKKSKQTQILKYNKIIKTIEQQLTKSKLSKTQFESQIVSQHQKIRQSLEYRIKQLEIELQNYKEQQQNYQIQNNNKSQQAIIQLKNYYELQKQKLQFKLIKQKQKYQKKIQQLIQQYQNKLQQQTNNLYEQIEQVRQQAMNMEHQLNQSNNNLKHQLQMKQRTYKNLQLIYTQEKVNFQKKEIQLAQKNQYLTLTLSQQKQSMQKKIDDIIKQKNKLQKINITLQHQKDQLSNYNKNKQQKISSLQTQLIQLNKEIQKIKNITRAKQTQQQNQFMDKVINYEKKIALMLQQKQFASKKSQDLQKFIQTKSKNYQQKIQSLKSQLNNIIKSNQQKRVKQLSQIQQKYQKIKRTSKQSENSYNKKISSLQRQLAIQKQKSINLQTRISQYKISTNSIEQKLSTQIQSIKQSHTQQKNQLIEKMQQYKQNIVTLEGEKQLINSQYEKQLILKENKIKYLQQNKQKNKKQILQKVKKYQELINKLEKEKKQQKHYYQTHYQQQIKKLQKKFNQEIKEIHANYQKRQAQTQQRFKLLQSQNRKLSQKLASSSNHNSQSSILQQRKLLQLQQNQKRLLKQLETIKTNNKSTSNDTFMLYEKQKQNLKSKLIQKQQKLRLAQKLKQQYFYQLQKEKAKTNVQKQSFIMKIQQLKQTISKYQRDLQKYQRQNQKLKVQKRQSTSKVSLGSRYSVNKSHFNGNNLTERSGLQESMSFLNVSVTSSIRGDTKQGKSFSKYGKQYLKYQPNMISRQNSQKFSEKNSQKGKDKQNFNPILDEESFFGNNY